ncbi:YggS family pyridoxal phosphate-dependent enzyme [Cellulomonas sp. URHD0024]|uniref:YggS family pyridoxal phosphate-dependent enzyme n=1 Tax=Cellulomonas sp. URHD0024 TaxID=1302620 RepID=UPI000407BE29|nr:YggS family pyridoxal phosphate-dependent enzyme [Cellulomonas sp. URHD0024]
MTVDPAAVADRLARLRARIAAAESAAGRPPGSVRLLLATKTQDAETIRAAVVADAGAPHPVLVGENRVQELVAKGPQLRDLGVTTHLIGPLQSNKVNAALRWASCIESVASLDLAQRLAARASGVEVYVQVNVSGEPTKHGVAPGDAVELARAIGALDGLRLGGWMTVGANSPDASVVSAGYALLRSLRDEVVASGAPGTADARELSMGMSGDLELAVAEGATLVRVGSALFGARPA